MAVTGRGKLEKQRQTQLIALIIRGIRDVPGWTLWLRPLIAALDRGWAEVNFCEFQASLVCMAGVPSETQGFIMRPILKRNKTFSNSYKLILAPKDTAVPDVPLDIC